jgi:SpoIID/LytB domain protein
LKLYLTLLLVLLSMSCSREQKTGSQVDTLLQTAAEQALGDLEGTIIIQDPRDGRIRAIVNRRLAFEQSYPPGSAIKPFLSLMLLRSGIIDPKRSVKCPAHFQSDNNEIHCTHKRLTGEIDLVRAIGHSCNYYFKTLGERVSSGMAESVYASFGFGRRSGSGQREFSGRVDNSQWGADEMIGDGQNLLVTPVQMLVAYSALVNGGDLYRPLIDGEVRRTGRIEISERDRLSIIEGMRESVVEGTASHADIQSLDGFVFGKTGTSTSSNRFRTHGWFIGFASRDWEKTNPELAVLVFLKKGKGKDCATIAKGLLSSYFDLEQVDEKGAEELTVGFPREQKSVRLSMNEYLAGVLEKESGSETEEEALKAQAIISRTYALSNMGRHKKEGFDFCNLTHCQAYSNKERKVWSRSIMEALRETEGLVLSSNNQLAEVYYHASCGGHTATKEHLWGGSSPLYLQGVVDEFCKVMPNSTWRYEIDREELTGALQRSPKMYMNSLQTVRVAKRDLSGRAELIGLEGERGRVVRGWDFRSIVCRELGWNTLKSSRFEVRRAGEMFVFTGSGLGHGLGLCQSGAHVMARRGLRAEQIVSFYFPGTKVTKFSKGLVKTGSGFKTLASEKFQLHYPDSLAYTDANLVLEQMERSRNRILEKLRRLSISFVEPRMVSVKIHDTVQEFSDATGASHFTVAVTSKDHIQTQPFSVLMQQRSPAAILGHEYVHALLEANSRTRIEEWLAEGLALHASGEGAQLLRQKNQTKELLHYSSVYRRTLDLIRERGERAVWHKALNGHRYEPESYKSLH